MTDQELVEKAKQLKIIQPEIRLKNLGKNELKRLVAEVREEQNHKYAKAGSEFVKVPELTLDTIFGETVV